MTPAAILRETEADGVTLALSPTGTIRATGDGEMVNRWLATVRAHKAALVEVLRSGPSAAAGALPWWLIHYRDRDPVEVACCPEATLAEILEMHPDALAAEPFAPAMRRPSAPLTASDEGAIRAWLELIEERNEATVAEVIETCQWDADAREYFAGRAAVEIHRDRGR